MKILFPTPVVYDGNDARFLARDGARMAECLVRMGHSAVKPILVGAHDSRRPASPLLAAASFEEWCDPAYWKSFGADGALCYFGLAASRFKPVVNAMKKAGLRLALKMDSSLGVQPSRFSIVGDIAPTYWYFRSRLSPPLALARTFETVSKRFFCFPSNQLRDYFTAFDLITAETPFAATNTAHWLIRRGDGELSERILVLPHPVPESFRRNSADPPKENIVFLAALDWTNPRKGASLSSATLNRFLSRHPTWSAVVAGKDSETVAKRAGSRVTPLPAMPSEQLIPFFRRARVFLMPSGHEGSPNVVFEAVACGCSVVYSSNIRQLSWLDSVEMGTMAARRTARSLAAALAREAAKWEKFPNRRATAPIGPLHVSEVCNSLLSHLFPPVSDSPRTTELPPSFAPPSSNPHKTPGTVRSRTGK